MGMGLRFDQNSHQDNGICSLGHQDLVKFGLENGKRIPFSVLSKKHVRIQSH